MTEAGSLGPLANANIGEVIVYVRDFEESVHFYDEQLGLAVDVKSDGVAGMRGTSGAEIVLHRGRTAEPGDASHWFIQFIVDDIEATVTELKARGIQVDGIQERPYGKYARFRDPEGNLLGLEEPPTKDR